MLNRHSPPLTSKYFFPSYFSLAGTRSELGFEGGQDKREQFYGMENVLKGGRTNLQNTYSVNLSQDVPVPAFWVIWIKSNLEQMLSHNMFG